MDKIDVFSNSWGPADDGKAMDEPGRLLTKVLYKGITEVGTIFFTLKIIDT